MNNDENNLDYWEDRNWSWDCLPNGILTVSPNGEAVFHGDLPFKATVTDALKIHRDENPPISFKYSS